MQLFIYRDRLGKKYPAFLLRLVIALAFALTSYIIVDDKITSIAFQSTFLKRFLICLVIQEWIFYNQLWIASKLFDYSANWKYGITQLVVGVILPTVVIMQFPALAYDPYQRKFDEMMPMNSPLYYHQMIIMMNVIFCTCRVFRSEYFTEFITKDLQDDLRIINVNDVLVIVNTGEECVVSMEDDCIAIKPTAKLNKDLNNLDPKLFKMIVKGSAIYINRNWSGDDEKKAQNMLIDHMAKLTFKTIKNEYIERDLERIRKQQSN
jgi:hypothetical protein